MSNESLKAKVRRIIEEGWNKGNLAAFDGYWAADVVVHTPNGTAHGREQIMKAIAAACSNTPDLHITIDDLKAVEGDMTMVRWTEEWTDTGGVLARGIPPSGKRLKTTGITLSRFAGGEVVEQWVETDSLGVEKQRQQAAQPMATEALKAKVRQVFERGWNKGDLTVFDEMYAADVAWHHPINPQQSRAGLKASCAAVRKSYPDVHVTIDDLIAAEGDKVVTRWTYEGTDIGGSLALGTPPTGKHVRFTGMIISRFAIGHIVEEWFEGDYLGLQKQLLG